MFILRQARNDDLESLVTLASQLGSAGSLGQDHQKLSEQIDKTLSCFKKAPADRSEGLYLFILEDYLRKEVVGSSLIFAKHGTKSSPHTYLKILEKKHEDQSTKISVRHEIIRLEFDEDGPTEIGGLILNQDYRGLPVGLGRLLSYGRFMYIGMFRDRFESEVIAELLPPFNEDGSSELWESYGRRFTGMDYQRADSLSRTNKDFIKNLFPTEDIYTSLFSEKARSVIGKTGVKTKAAQKLLEKIGFRFLNAVDPFDGGPHFGAKTNEVSLVKKIQKVQLSSEVLPATGNRGLLSFDSENGFCCLSLHFKLDDNSVILAADAKKIIEDFRADPNELFLVTLP